MIIIPREELHTCMYIDRGELSTCRHCLKETTCTCMHRRKNPLELCKILYIVRKKKIEGCIMINTADKVLVLLNKCWP